MQGNSNPVQGADKQGAPCELEVAETSPRYLDLYKYADKYDKLLMVLGTIGAAGEGASVPIICLVLSRLINSFGTFQNDGSKMASEVSKYCLIMVYIGIFGWVTAYLEVSCWIRTGERQAATIRAKYLRAILRQNVGFFDAEGTSTAAEVVSNVAKDSETIQDAMSEKVGNFIANVVQLLAAYIVGFYICWQLALIALALTPVVLVPGVVYKKALTDLTVKMMAEYDKANVVAEEAVSSIRTVHSFTAEKRTVSEFTAALAGTLKLGFKQGLAKGVALASTGISYLLWAVMAWVGQVLVEKHKVNGAEVVLLGFVVISAAVSLSQATPSIRSFTEGSLAAHRMFKVIDRIPPIDSDDMSGQILEDIQGRVEFKDVHFCYPSRPEVQVLNAFNLRIAAGMNVALVGSSGSGKSTVIALMERFYDPQRGEVLIDDLNIKKLQLKSLRRQIGLVSQEPALFATTIKENIMYGKEDATLEEIVEAAKAANAHGFICQCPQGYDTQVGERGVQMSGGQKQRIAIARAILKNPPILLLDEATSALDAESERVVQQTLEKAAKGRTTLTVAHRLSTIRNADTIAVMQSGKVVELGDHDDLLTKGGVYSGLVRLQQSQPTKVNAAKHGLDQSLRSSLQSKGISRGSSRGSSLRCSSLSRSLRMLTLSGSLKRALNEAFADKADDFDSILDPRGDTEVTKPVNDQKLVDVTIWRLLALNAPEWKEALIPSAGAIGFGFIHPVFSYLLGQLLETFYEPSASAAKQDVRIVSGVFAGLMVLSTVTNIIQHYYFAIMGEELTARVRTMMLSQILRFEIGWFDKEENSSGAICGRLGTDASLVRSLVGDRIALMVSTISALAVAYSIGFALSWRITVVIIALQPIIIICYCTKRMFLDNFAQISARGQLEASQVASEAVSQLRTITAFSSQDRVMSLFESKLKGPRRQTANRSHVAGLGVGASFGVMFSSWALLLWYGAQVVKQHKASFGTFIKAYFTLVSTGRILADTIIVLTPDLARSSQCVNSVFDILDKKTKIEPDDERGEKPSKLDGNVELQNVTFAYPARPQIMVFKGFNIMISAGRTVAMVGQSGSGKSTIIGLIERFYDPLYGRVLINGKDITQYNLRAMRAHIGLVSQEPTLFATTIKENIAYGRENCTEAEIIEAAKATNAHTFICSLPDGYNTFVGARGLLLSGGQKQRIAIARAVLKNPSILLLDEATSALDAESEALVQNALDKMMVGRTTVVVAHRLSTIRQAHTIAVLQEGRILEQGTHEQLMAKGEGGAYSSLVQIQTKA